MSSLYRLRPYNKNTISEIADAYLWFSKPSEYNDTEDSNVCLMIEKNEILQRAFSIVLNENGIEELKRLMKYIGICCFTTEIPSKDNRVAFPKGKKSICIEYDKEKLSDYFLNVKGISNCFKDVIYSDEPIKVEHDGDYHILMRKDESGEFYESILQMQRDPDRFMDKLLFFLLTRIKERFAKQKELRIIWGGFRIKENDELGYHIDIPKECIKCIYVYSDTPAYFIKQIEELVYPIRLIE